MLKLSSFILRRPPIIRSTRTISSSLWCQNNEDRQKKPRLLLLNNEALKLMQPHYLVQTRYLFTTQKLAKESTLSKIKQMIRDYWYVIIPVEVVTSVMWYGGFFLMLKSGVDIVQLLTNIGVSEQTLRFPVSIITFNIQGIYLEAIIISRCVKYSMLSHSIF